MIYDDDFLPIDVDKRRKDVCDTRGCRNSGKDMQIYLTEWHIQTGASDQFRYCEECILKAYPNIRTSEPVADKEVKLWPYCDKQKIELTARQEMILLHNILMNWSPTGFAKKYSMEAMLSIRTFLDEAIEVKRTLAK